jgi:hypothetical protein
MEPSALLHVTMEFMRSITERVDKHRAKLKAAGLRPVQLWLPDTRKRGFRAASWSAEYWLNV